MFDNWDAVLAGYLLFLSLSQFISLHMLQGDRVETPIMFTRLDSERNAKVMKRAVNEERLPVEKYQVSGYCIP